MQGSIKTIRDGVHRLRYDTGISIDGTRAQKCETFFGRRDAAEKRLRNILKAYDDGIGVEPTKMTLGQWLLEWLESAKGRLRAASYTRYKGIIEQTILKSPIATIPLQRLRPTHLETYYTSATVSASTLTLHHAILHRALRKAVRDRLIAVNPARDLEGRPKRSHSRDDARKHAWNLTEVQRFLDAANQAGAQAAAFYTLALDSGMRKGELCGLKWEDVDLDGARVTVVRQLLAATVLTDVAADGTETTKLQLGPTKTGKVRTITLSAETVGLLREHRRGQREEMMSRRDDWKDFGLVFTRAGGLPVPMNNLGEREYARLIEAAGVRPIKFHGLRHTCATLLLQAGTPVHVVSERLGHSKVSMTMEVYAHVLPDMQRDAATTMGTLLRRNR